METAMASSTETVASRPETPISIWNVLNLVAYLANVEVACIVGLFGSLGQGDNAKIFAKYQTLLTPTKWTFAIWAVIFLAQLVWVVLQIGLPRYRDKAVLYVNNYYYLMVCLAQIGWTFAFGYRIIWLSMVFMTLVLVYLGLIVKQSRRVKEQHNEAVRFEEYAVLEFPFTIHMGWIIAATLLNANIVLVACHVNKKIELFVAIVSLVAMAIACFVSLAQPDFVIPLALIWALVGIYVQLNNHVGPIGHKFSEHSLSIIQRTAGVAIVAIVVSFFIRLYTSWKEYRQTPRSSLHEPLMTSSVDHGMNSVNLIIN